MRHRHPGDGELRLDLHGEWIHVSCRWPADLDLDEWITIGTCIPSADYAAALNGLDETDHHRIAGRVGGFVELTQLDEATIRIEVADSQGDHPTRLSLNVPAASFVLAG